MTRLIFYAVIIFGEETWFRIQGDRDAATNLMRTNMLKDGKNLGFITDWLCKKFAVGTKIIPMTDNNVETRIKHTKRRCICKNSG